jgi:hypothetical protein
MLLPAHHSLAACSPLARRTQAAPCPIDLNMYFIRHHWVLEFLKTRNSKLDTGGISPLFGLKT